MSHRVRWGILAPGNIAKQFAEGLTSTPGASLVAVGSRSLDRANAFAEQFGAERAHGSYEDLVADDGVDAVYVASPHTCHAEHALLAIGAGKAVLCEKPFTVNLAQAESVVQAARETNVFCMEAMWTRFLPSMVRLRELIAAGTIGEVRMVTADFAFRSGGDPASRLMNPALAGGGLLDVGVYCASLIHMILGEPTDVCGFADIGPTGVDDASAVSMAFEGGRLAQMVSGVRLSSPHEARVLGTEGRIELGKCWWRGADMELHLPGKDPETISVPQDGNGYNYQAMEVARCLSEGKTESDVMSLDSTLEIMRTLDRVRACWGLTYPFE